MEAKPVSKLGRFSAEGVALLEQARRDAAAGKSGRVFGDDYPRLGTKPKARPVVEPQPEPKPVVEKVVEYRDTPETLAEIERLRAALDEASRPPQDTEGEERPQQLPPEPQDGKGLPDSEEKILPPELSDFMEEGETLEDAVNRMTPDLDSLINLSGSLDDSSVGAVIGAMSKTKRIEWMGKLYREKSKLRNLRNTDDEDLPREGRIDRLSNLFASVGART